MKKGKPRSGVKMISLGGSESESTAMYGMGAEWAEMLRERLFSSAVHWPI